MAINRSIKSAKCDLQATIFLKFSLPILVCNPKILRQHHYFKDLAMHMYMRKDFPVYSTYV